MMLSLSKSKTTAVASALPRCHGYSNPSARPSRWEAGPVSRWRPVTESSATTAERSASRAKQEEGACFVSACPANRTRLGSQRSRRDAAHDDTRNRREQTLPEQRKHSV